MAKRKPSEVWTTQDELRFLETEMIRERIVNTWEKTERVYIPTRLEVQHMYKRYLEGLEKRKVWGDIDREVILNRCLRLIHDPPEVEVTARLLLRAGAGGGAA